MGTQFFDGDVHELAFAEPEPTQGTDLRRIAFESAVVRDVHLDLNWTHLVVAWSEFELCSLTQHGRPLLNSDGAAAQGNLGARPSVYRRCSFVGVRFGAPGRFAMGSARFEDCTFTNCTFNANIAIDAEFVHCVFIGKIDGAVWFGENPDTGRVNEFTDNDFTDARITANVAFRRGIDPAASLWPEGYIPVDDERPAPGIS